MLEGLIQSYLTAFGRAWVPGWEPGRPDCDSKSPQTELSLSTQRQGEVKDVQAVDRSRRTNAKFGGVYQY